MIVKSNHRNRGGFGTLAPSIPVKVEEPKTVPEVEVEEEIIEDPDDGEGEG